MQGLIGKKIGMTRIFDKDTGTQIPVTVIETGSNVVHQIKTVEKDGYSAVQLGFGKVAEKNVTKPRLGHFKKHGGDTVRIIKEFKIDQNEQIEPGQKIGPEVFDDVLFVNITGTVKGRGFTGTVKRWNFSRGRETHGNTNHRAPGSIGSCSYPARVFPGMKMSGQHGNTTETTKGIRIVAIEKENGLLYVKGAVPGANRGIVYIKKNLVKGL